MNFDVKAVHFNLHDDTQDFIEKKLHKVDYAKDHIVDLLFTLTKMKREFLVEAKLHFKWGKTFHIKVNSPQLLEGIDIIFDKIDHKVAKEKEKIQNHSVRTPAETPQ